MKATAEGLRLSASDLANHVGCRHLSYLDLCVVRGEMEPPSYTDITLEALKSRGLQHEKAYVEHLRGQGLSVVELEDLGAAEAELAATCEAMQQGPDVIVQATFLGQGWMGRADILRRVERDSPGLGNYAYEVLETKLALKTRGRTILQLCLYSELVERIQGVLPERMYVVPPGQGAQAETYRTADYMAYYRLVRSRLTEAVRGGRWHGGDTYPVPCEQCSICRWWRQCEERRRRDDHLSLVAGISRAHIAELEERSTDTVEALASLTLPLDPRPKRGSPEAYERLCHQARVQVAGRRAAKPVYELLPREGSLGFYRLPKPSPHDVFLDLEAARYVGEGGLEYLFGWAALDETGRPRYEALWATNQAEERTAFEQFIDEAMARWQADEGFHIYHYAPYEPSAVKRLMGRHATREDEVDRLLRGERFVDLYALVRQAVRAGVESYSLKDLEPFFGYERHLDLREATQHLRAVELALEFGAPEAITLEHRRIVQEYNRDDCLATLALREWLEGLRQSLVDAGETIPRPELKAGDPSEELDEALSRSTELARQLLAGLPAERKDRTDQEQAQWILAHLLDWHRREDKAMWWEYFRLVQLSDEDLLEEPVAMGGLEYRGRLGSVGRGSVIDRYGFPHQETRLRVGDRLLSLASGTAQFGTVARIDTSDHTIDLRKGPKWADVHPQAIFAHEIVRTGVLREALLRTGQWVAEHAIDAAGAHRADRDLLLRRRPRLRSGTVEAVAGEAADTLQAARRLALELDGVLPIQGPPGSGKTYTGARMICEAVAAGKKVGITAVSHKVIRNLLEEAVAAASQEGLKIRCVQKINVVSDEDPPRGIAETRKNEQVFAELDSGKAQVGAGTAWLWAREEAAGAVDILFVDEAGQISLANVMAVSQAAKSVVLLGDPQQLEQPQRGSHPEGTDLSALEHLLGDHQTLPAERGLFLETTWRLHPALCSFTSELFYEGRLHSRSDLHNQVICGRTRWAGAGLWYIPVVHAGNRNESPEEAAIVERLVGELVDSDVRWVDKEGLMRPLTLDDVLIVAPYNAQVALLLEELPQGTRVGTVDRFQGQEAPVVIYSMSSSSPEEAPRGMEFLYNLGRLNVATSRARCACFLLGSPSVFEPECRTPGQMKLANAFCRYLELALVATG